MLGARGGNKGACSPGAHATEGDLRPWCPGCNSSLTINNNVLNSLLFNNLRVREAFLRTLKSQSCYEKINKFYYMKTNGKKKKAHTKKGFDGQGNEDILLNGYEVFFGGDKNMLELDRGGGCTTL